MRRFFSLQRRHFLQSASSLIGAPLLDRYFPSQDLEKIFADVRANLLEMVNEERSVEKVQLLQMDELATQVATKHAMEMATHGFASHWNREGLKPYHRYSLAGGVDATQENVSAQDSTFSLNLRDLKQDTSYLHVRLYQEKPPNDGHRKTILAPQHTHVGFGLAVDSVRLRMVELFVAKYVKVEPMTRIAKPGDTVRFKARVVKPPYIGTYVEVVYEPLPPQRDITWLNERRNYSLPSESRVLRPKLPPPYTYQDNALGVVTINSDLSFEAPIKLFKKEPGIYTVVLWIKRQGEKDTPFPATEVCIRAE